MKMKIVKTVIVLTAIVLSGCTSVPPPSAENQCMLLINREFERASSFEPYVKYSMLIDDQSEPYIRFDASSHFLLIEGLEPGNHRIDEIIAVMKSGDNSWPVPNSNIKFVLKEGFVTILDKTFLVTLEPMETETKGRNHWYRQDMKIIQLSEEQAEEMINEFQSKDTDGLWRF